MTCYCYYSQQVQTLLTGNHRKHGFKVLVLKNLGIFLRDWPLFDVNGQNETCKQSFSFGLAQEKHRKNFVAHLEQMYRTLSHVFGACARLSIVHMLIYLCFYHPLFTLILITIFSFFFNLFELQVLICYSKPILDRINTCINQ